MIRTPPRLPFPLPLHRIFRSPPPALISAPASGRLPSTTCNARYSSSDIWSRTCRVKTGVSMMIMAETRYANGVQLSSNIQFAVTYSMHAYAWQDVRVYTTLRIWPSSYSACLPGAKSPSDHGIRRRAAELHTRPGIGLRAETVDERLLRLGDRHERQEEKCHDQSFHRAARSREI